MMNNPLSGTDPTGYEPQTVDSQDHKAPPAALASGAVRSVRSVAVVDINVPGALAAALESTMTEAGAAAALQSQEPAAPASSGGTTTTDRPAVEPQDVCAPIVAATAREAEVAGTDRMAGVGGAPTISPPGIGSSPGRGSSWSPELFGGLDLDVAGVFGVEVSAGIMLNLKDPAASGVYGCVAPAVGFSAGVGGQAGIALRGVEGGTVGVDVNSLKAGGSLIWDKRGFNGGSVSLGPGLGVSVSAGNTNTYTLRQLGNDLGRAWNAIVCTPQD